MPTDACIKCGGTLVDVSTHDKPGEFKCGNCGAEYMPAPKASFVANPPCMRSAHDIRSMIDYLMARDPQHPDLSAFRWVLGEGKPTQLNGDAALIEANKDLSRMVIEQSQEIASLKEKLSRFVTPVTRMQP